MRIFIPKKLSIGSAFILFSLLNGYLAGISLAIGFWSTLISIIFPPYSLYLLVSRILDITKWLV